jgi:hypothetical protein
MQPAPAGSKEWADADKSVISDSLMPPNDHDNCAATRPTIWEARGFAVEARDGSRLVAPVLKRLNRGNTNYIATSGFQLVGCNG